MGTKNSGACGFWFTRLVQVVLLAAIIGTGIASGQAVTTGIFHWWIYPALICLFVVTFMFYHLLACQRSGAKSD